MAKLDLALVVRTVDKATQPLRRIQKSVRDIGRQTGLDRVSRGVGRVGRQMRKVGSEALLFGKKFGLLAGGAGALVGGFALKASAQMETLQVSFESMLGSAAKAKDMVRNLSDFAAKTPFQLLDIGSATKSLLAFGVKAKDMIGTLSFLGDIAAGAGVPLKGPCTDLRQDHGQGQGPDRRTEPAIRARHPDSRGFFGEACGQLRERRSPRRMSTRRRRKARSRSRPLKKP